MNHLNHQFQRLAVLLFFFSTANFNLKSENLPPAHCWDGGGGNNLWSNPLNWCGDNVPGNVSIVSIDAGYVVNLDVSTGIKGLDLYGKIVGSGNITIAQDCLLAGGSGNGFFRPAT